MQKMQRERAKCEISHVVRVQRRAVSEVSRGSDQRMALNQGPSEPLWGRWFLLDIGLPVRLIHLNFSISS
jgi:hypothetical protein